MEQLQQINKLCAPPYLPREMASINSESSFCCYVRLVNLGFSLCGLWCSCIPDERDQRLAKTLSASLYSYLSCFRSWSDILMSNWEFVPKGAQQYQALSSTHCK
ncbi:uncharacterized protein LOC119562601 [Drosophila subpulchrella]|uniref:uncharacterized protein LOC119562601 n=1 Tax=Drosophila subpulchrella TaxID=1486046 RepID=UPI0018A17321|nr:uncharacterized protein LOC119562601 [Drosophila subpulchrella]